MFNTGRVRFNGEVTARKGKSSATSDQAAEIMNRPLKGVEEHKRMLNENLFQRHEQWCKELRDATLDVLTGADLVAARRSFDHAARSKARVWYEAKDKLQQFGRIHAWAVSGREGLPKRYKSEGAEIAYSFTRGLSWREWCHWQGWSECSDCKDLFRNPYWRKMHTCVRSDDAESRPSE